MSRYYQRTLPGSEAGQDRGQADRNEAGRNRTSRTGASLAGTSLAGAGQNEAGHNEAGQKDRSRGGPRRSERDGNPAAVSRVGVILLNLGGPATQEEVEPFLVRLFSDREIIQLPGGPSLQPAFARLIAKLRGAKVRRSYRSIGGGSPILALTKRQAEALETALNATGVPGSGPAEERAPRFKVAIAMRYTSPSAEEALSDMQAAGVERMVALTLYPQFSAATTRSSLNDLRRAADRLAGVIGLPLTAIDRYADHPGYLDALTATVFEGLGQFPVEERNEVVLLFSAHGLPVRFIRSGDPYVGEIQSTLGGVLARLRAAGVNNPHRFGYQSRTGPVKWIEPYTDRVIEELARQRVRSVLVVPIAFVSDHIETLYEIDQLFGDLARRKGIVTFRRTRMLNDDPGFVAALAGLVREHLARQEAG